MLRFCEIGKEQDLWQARMLAGLYLSMPDVVNNDDRLIAWVKNVAGLSGSERGYRCPGE